MRLSILTKGRKNAVAAVRIPSPAHVVVISDASFRIANYVTPDVAGTTATVPGPSIVFATA